MKEMRPTTGKVMQALFNMLGNIHGRGFLDLFAGTGQIAFEAASRGASPVVLVESDRKRFGEILRRTPQNVSCRCMDVRRALPLLAKKGEKFDIIFADPPYCLGWGAELPKLFAANAILSPAGGLVIFEHSVREEPADPGGAFGLADRRVYGGTALSIYERKIDE